MLISIHYSEIKCYLINDQISKFEFISLVVKFKQEVCIMKKSAEKTKKPKTTASDLYDCCWYEPSCDNLCCGGVCSCAY
jgi:hypothetical protein